MITSLPGLHIAVDLGLEQQKPISCESGINLFVHLEIDSKKSFCTSKCSCSGPSQGEETIVCPAQFQFGSGQNVVTGEHYCREHPEPSGQFVDSSIPQIAVDIGEISCIRPNDDHVEQEVEVLFPAGRCVKGLRKQCQRNLEPSGNDDSHNEDVNTIVAPLVLDSQVSYPSLSFKEKCRKVLNFVLEDGSANTCDARRDGKELSDFLEDDASDKSVTDGDGPYFCSENRSWSPDLEDYSFGDIDTARDRELTACQEHEMRKTMELVLFECPDLPLSPDTLPFIHKFNKVELSAVLLLLEMGSCEDLCEGKCVTSDRGGTIGLRLGASDAEGKSISAENIRAALPRLESCVVAADPSNVEQLSWVDDDSPRIDCVKDSRTFGLRRIKPKRTQCSLSSEVGDDVNELVVLDCPSRKRLCRSLEKFERQFQSFEIVHL